MGMSLREVWDRYMTANREYRRLLTRAPIGQQADPDSPLARARREETQALADYLELLRDLAQFAPTGKLREGQPCRN
jgi:hypothetical protein